MAVTLSTKGACGEYGHQKDMYVMSVQQNLIINTISQLEGALSLGTVIICNILVILVIWGSTLQLAHINVPRIWLYHILLWYSSVWVYLLPHNRQGWPTTPQNLVQIAHITQLTFSTITSTHSCPQDMQCGFGRCGWREYSMVFLSKLVHPFPTFAI